MTTKRPSLWIPGLSLALVFAICPGQAGAAAPGSETQDNPAAAVAPPAWSNVPAILSHIVPPRFPNRTFAITDFGAKGDGAADCTEAFRKAIDACNQAGGGKVVIPAGVYLTGAIHLKSNVDLDLAPGATIRFNTDPRSYLPVVFTRYEGTEVMNYSPFIYALGQENIAITGRGTIDGQGSRAVWYSWKQIPDPKQLVEMGDRGVPLERRIFGESHHLRPNFIEPVRCRNVLIEGVRIIDSPMWVLHPLYCTNVTIVGVTVDTQGPNTDGCDPDSCTDVLIRDCHFSDGDDCIAIKSGRDADGRRVNIPSQNLVIQHCVFKDGHGGVTVGSETSGGVENVFAEDCRFDSPNLDIALRLKTGMTRGGFIRDVYIRNCTVTSARTGIGMTMRYPGTLGGQSIPVIRDIDIRHCTFDRLSRQPILIEGFSDSVRITDATIADCIFPGTGMPSLVTNASRIHLIANQGGGLN
ncbi:MAG TPA: glycoside hydrolase family 28 protein [Verrucomicrobiae bacterium]|nr:glycoside hydrolase family 28 protein [Verrucomicrobiae bacterium]